MTNKKICRLSRKYNFTIVELIVVMLIMTLMLTATLPMFTQLGKGYKMTQAAQEIIGQISIAKAYAMANHCHVAVIFPQKSDFAGFPGVETARDSSPLSSYYNAACRIAIVTKNSNSEYEFVMWKPDSNWVFLPEGTILCTADSDFSTTLEPLEGVRLGELVKHYERNPSTEAINTVCTVKRHIIITPEGQIATNDNQNNQSNQEIEIRIMEGGFNKSAGRIIQYERIQGKNAYQKIKIDPFSMRANFEEFVEN